jgi:hypothetical protein
MPKSRSVKFFFQNFFHQEKMGTFIIIIIVIWGVSSVKLTNFATLLEKFSKLFITLSLGEKKISFTHLEAQR